jgi:ABC-type phosphate/phosphonate transport system substrate-binding protein
MENNQFDFKDEYSGFMYGEGRLDEDNPKGKKIRHVGGLLSKSDGLRHEWHENGKLAWKTDSLGFTANFESITNRDEKKEAVLGYFRDEDVDILHVEVVEVEELYTEDTLSVRVRLPLEQREAVERAIIKLDSDGGGKYSHPEFAAERKSRLNHG